MAPSAVLHRSEVFHGRYFFRVNSRAADATEAAAAAPPPRGNAREFPPWVCLERRGNLDIHRFNHESSLYLIQRPHKMGFKFPSFTPLWPCKIHHPPSTIHHPPRRRSTGQELGVDLVGGNLYQVMDTHLGVSGSLKGRATQKWLKDVKG